MTTLLWITGILWALYFVSHGLRAIFPKKSGDDYAADVVGAFFFFCAAVFSVLTFLVWI
ncbi:hypothetical protein KAR91_51850 [Candidatus Pacearchaeota archaeon]|nr:hypothetical protein [Candidatus Pacearchaeota archaeon]